MARKSIAFVWQGYTERKDHWRDGLYWAMKQIEKHHDVTYHEPWDDITDVDLILYWESPCTWGSPTNGPHYRKVQSSPIKKALLFSGGPIELDWVKGFDHIFVESLINKEEFDKWGVSNSVAFGVDAETFRPMNLKKRWTGIHQGTSASWKRQWLMAEALREDCVLVGRHQPEDPYPFDRSRELGAQIFEEVPYPVVAGLINESEIMVQTSDFWGGGQRATLEAMACGIPVICMTDSPKNREYVEESGAGLVVEPNEAQIRWAVEEIKKWTPEQKARGREYVLSKWTAKHYADNLLEWIDR